MKLDIIGSAGSYPGPGTACSSYLVRSGRTSLLLDAGNGSQSNLYQAIDPDKLDGIVISHGHVDHFADLVGIYHFLKFARPPATPVPVFTTDDVHQKLQSILGQGQIDASILSVHAVTPGDTIQIGKITLEFFEGMHPVPTLVTRITDGHSSMCYGADGDTSQGLAFATRSVDLFLGESTWEKRGSSHPTGLHLDASSLARLAQAAEAAMLVVTHIAYPANADAILEIVKKGFSGAAHIARDGQSYSF